MGFFTSICILSVVINVSLFFTQLEDPRRVVGCEYIFEKLKLVGLERMGDLFVAMCLLLAFLTVAFMFYSCVPTKGYKTRLQEKRHRWQRERLCQADQQIFNYNFEIKCTKEDVKLFRDIVPLSEDQLGKEPHWTHQR